MKYQALLTLGVVLILTGYVLMESGGRVLYVHCQRTESRFLPVCHLSEYFLGLFPAEPTRTVDEITALSQTGKMTKDFYLVQRLPNAKLAPVNLNRVQMEAGRSYEQEPLASLNRLAAFFQRPDSESIKVRLENESGNVPLGILLFVLGLALVVQQQVRHQRNKAQASEKLIHS